MRISKIFCVVCTILAVSSCNHLELPKIQDCIQLTDTMFCINTALDEDDPDREVTFDLSETRGYMCTNPKDREKMENAVLNLAEEYEILERKYKRLRRRCSR